MIFAHGPLGFSLAWLTKLLTKTKLTKKESLWLFVIGYIGGIFPDIDLFYYYLVDASRSHREMLTHTPILYLVIFCIVGAVLLTLKKRKAFFAFAVFILGTLSHLVTDGIVSQIRYFYPFSKEFYGVADLGIPLVNNNLLYVNALVEGIFITLFFYLLIVLYAKKDRLRMILTTILMIVFAAGVVTITVVNQHIYTPSFEELYSDLDNDGIVNYQDDDIDGDEVLNIDDTDSDGDGEYNLYELVLKSESFHNVWYDPTNGGLIQIPARLGFLTTDDYIMKLYNSFGVFIALEMEKDYEANPDGYELPPTDSNFDRNLTNLRTWFDHTGRLQNGSDVTRPLFGDVLFFETGHVVVVTGVDKDSNIQVLDVHKEYGVVERYLYELIEREGEIKEVGHILDPIPFD